MVESVKSLGLPVCVKPFLSNATYDSNFEYSLKDFSLLFAAEKGGVSVDESCIHNWHIWRYLVKQFVGTSHKI